MQLKNKQFSTNDSSIDNHAKVMVNINVVSSQFLAFERLSCGVLASFCAGDVVECFGYALFYLLTCLDARVLLDHNNEV